jgi:ABC-type bacteriocin/lantibiotic exporter with double-glycine peptidase domain
MNSSIKQNILFGKNYNDKLFRECIEVCELTNEIEQMKDNEEYQVGLNGNNLSGG